MIGLDTNVLVRYLVRDDEQQAEAARALLASLSPERPGFVCREVIVELVWVLERAYGFSPVRISRVLLELAATESLVMEAAGDVARAALRYRASGGGFSDLMILAAAAVRCASALHLRQESRAGQRRDVAVNLRILSTMPQINRGTGWSRQIFLAAAPARDRLTARNNSMFLLDKTYHNCGDFRILFPHREWGCCPDERTDLISPIRDARRESRKATRISSG